VGERLSVLVIAKFVVGTCLFIKSVIFLRRMTFSSVHSRIYPIASADSKQTKVSIVCGSIFYRYATPIGGVDLDAHARVTLTRVFIEQRQLRDLVMFFWSKSVVSFSINQSIYSATNSWMASQAQPNTK